MTPMDISIALTGSISILGYGLAAIGGGIGVGMIFAALINGTARQPEAHSTMFGNAVMGFAVVEALAIFGLVLVFMRM